MTFAPTVAIWLKFIPSGPRTIWNPVSLDELSCQVRSISVLETAVATRLDGAAGVAAAVGVGVGVPVGAGVALGVGVAVGANVAVGVEVGVGVGVADNVVAWAMFEYAELRAPLKALTR